MSVSGIFTLIINNGIKGDRILLATKFLNEKLKKIVEKRKEAGADDTDILIEDIEESHILYLKSQFKPYCAIGYEYNKIPISNVILGTEIQYSIPAFGDFFSDMFFHIKIKNPIVTIPDSDEQPLYRWCDYPGEKILQRVQFNINGTTLDETYPETYNFHRQFKISKDKLTGWNKMMGQETIKECISYDINNNTENSIEPLNYKSCSYIKNGYQTYKTEHGDLELIIPFLFWFNLDKSLAIPSVSIPYGQRFFNIKLAKKEQLLRAIINPTSTNSNLSNPTISELIIENCDLYINNLFVNPDIHDIYMKHVGFQLVRTYVYNFTTLKKQSDSILLHHLKFPIETLYMGIRPHINKISNSNVTSTGNYDSIIDPEMDDWHKYELTYNTIKNNIMKEKINHINYLGIQSNGMLIYSSLPSIFYNSYIPYTYGGTNIMTPTDSDLYMVTFNLYPGTYQPSGYINISRAREFYLIYKSNYINENNKADLIVIGIALRFFIIEDGRGEFRFTT